jgi:hypothetical protein
MSKTFVQVPNKLFYEFGWLLSNNALVIYMTLLDRRFDKPGMKYAFCSDKTLSDWTGISKKHIYEYRKELINECLIDYVPPKDDFAARYYLHIRPLPIEYVCVPKQEVLYNHDLKPNEKILYIIYLMTFNKELGYSFPPRDKTAKWLNCSARTISNLNDKLVEKGFLEKSNVRRQSGSWGNNRYVPKIMIDEKVEEPIVKPDDGLAFIKEALRKEEEKRLIRRNSPYRL